MFEFVKKNADTDIFWTASYSFIKAIERILSFTHFFKHTAIILNATVHEMDGWIDRLQQYKDTN